MNCEKDGDSADGPKGAGKAWDATPTASSKASTCETFGNEAGQPTLPGLNPQANACALELLTLKRLSEVRTSNRITPSAAGKATKGQDGQELSCSNRRGP